MNFNIRGLELEIKQHGPERGGQPGECVSQNRQKCPSSSVFLARHPVEQRSAIFDFLGHMISVTTLQLCCWSMTAALDDTSMNTRGCVPIKLIYKNRQGAECCPGEWFADPYFRITLWAFFLLNLPLRRCWD